MSDNSNKQKDPNQNNNTNPMDEPKDVERSKDPHIDEDFPGYPHQPASEDIMNPSNHTQRVNADVDAYSKQELGRMHLDTTKAEGATPTNEEDDLGIVEGTEADLTEDDKIALGSMDRDMDLGEDETRMDPDFKVQHDTEDVEAVDEHLNNVHDDELDVPGEEDDDANEAIGEEDEENNYYSLGGDGKD
jgi:hypothetical protein